MQCSLRFKVSIYASIAISLFILAAAAIRAVGSQDDKPQPPKIVRKSGSVLQESAIKRVEPVYPPEAKAKGIGGTVLVEVTTDEEGKVIATRVVSGDALFRDAAASAARGWVFAPTKLSGTPVKVIGVLTFDFDPAAKPITDEEKKPIPDDTKGALGYSSAVISIPRDDEYYFGKDRVTLEEIPLKVKRVFEDKLPDEQIVYIKAGRFLKYGTVVSVIDTVREAGFDRIGLVTEKAEGEGEPSKPEERSQASREKPDGNESPGLSGLVLIEVKPGLRVTVNARPVSLNKLGATLKQILRKQESQAVFIKAPKSMVYGDVVAVIDIAKAAGANPIGLQVDYLGQ